MDDVRSVHEGRRDAPEDGRVKTRKGIRTACRVGSSVQDTVHIISPLPALSACQDYVADNSDMS